MIDLQAILILLITISIVAVLVSYIRLPYTIALVIIGYAIGYYKIIPTLHLTSEAIFTLIIPILIFEGAIHIPATEFSRNIRTILLLAIPGLIICIVLFSVGSHYIIGLDWKLAILMGSLISATDPVSILSIFRKIGVNLRLSVILEGESLLNDGVAVVMFQISLLAIITGSYSISNSILQFFKVTLGGVALGFIFGFITTQIIKNVSDHLVELTITTIMVYSLVLVAERVHSSSIIALLVAGLVIGNYAFREAFSASSRVILTSFWEYAAFIANSIIFLFIGNQVAEVDIIHYIKYIFLAWLLTFASRSFMVYTLTPLTSRFGTKIPNSFKHILNIGGLRGAIALALVLSIPKELEGRNTILILTFGVVFLSLIIQGLSTQPVMRIFRIGKTSEERKKHELLLTQIVGYNAVLNELKQSYEKGLVNRTLYSKLLKNYTEKINDFENKIYDLCEDCPELLKTEEILTKKRLLEHERDSIREIMQKGLISRGTFDEISVEIDKELADIISEIDKKEKGKDMEFIFFKKITDKIKELFRKKEEKE
jgi:CPA1 family monovalent cation:H+ antiporter